MLCIYVWRLSGVYDGTIAMEFHNSTVLPVTQNLL